MPFQLHILKTYSIDIYIFACHITVNCLFQFYEHVDYLYYKCFLVNQIILDLCTCRGQAKKNMTKCTDTIFIKLASLYTNRVIFYKYRMIYVLFNKFSTDFAFTSYFFEPKCKQLSYIIYKIFLCLYQDYYNHLGLSLSVMCFLAFHISSSQLKRKDLVIGLSIIH